MVKLEAGKYYKTRDGRKVGPMRRYENSSCHWDITDDDNDWQNYLIYGSHGESLDQCTDTDIVSEWVDYSSCESAQVDVQREEYGPIRTRRDVSTPTTNPKQQYGDKKPALAQLPLAGMIAQSLAHMDGDYKYGFRNWRDDPVEAITYVNAALRHLMLWAEGEENARDTDIPNLGGVMACCAILLDAQANGTLIDDRSASKAACDALHDAEKNVAYLKQLALDRKRDKV